MLFFIFISAAASITLSGCGGFVSGPAAPVIDATGSRSTGSAPAVAARTPPQPAPTESTASPRPSTDAAEMLFQALASLDVDYRYGGSSRATGFDCSGLVVHVFREAYGLALPRNARAQADAGKPVTAEELLPGDLVFYNTLNRPYSHVGIYLGDGRFIHAPRTGAQVRVENLNSTYWSRRWNGARRIALLTSP